MISTKNIKLCAFLKINDINPVEVIKVAKGKAEFVYDIEEKEFNMWQINFNQSKFLDFANAIEAIKNLAY